MMEHAPESRLIVFHASKDAFAPKTPEILSRLGYEIVSPEDWEQGDRAEVRPDLLLIDERRLVEAEIYDGEGEDSLPIVLLSGRHGATGADPRIVGAVKRPAGLHDLYRLMQQIFEDTPRSTPRIATQLRARCRAGDRIWEGRVLSLSENGCLLRSPETILLGREIQLGLTLPGAGEVLLDAEAAYQLLPDTGLVFNALSPAEREVLGRFVSQTLLAA
ncbi:MAG: PilZ domain-containing protein [Deltaproteobacteria bacterium]|jgi:hypothetical protein|nr:PilZ domain-containing protein [Deltaproteobacteria bacterium]MBW2496956.1 PilZ domain-containing protein [Deltaproteobacteria bacterium]